MFPFIANSLLLIAGGLTQLTDYVFINGIKPDISLILIASIFSFDKSWKKRILYVLLAGIVLKITPIPGPDVWLFITAAFIIGILIDYLPWSSYISAFVAIIVGTLVMNAQSFEFSTVLYALTYNLMIGFAVFMIYSKINGKKISRA